MLLDVLHVSSNCSFNGFFVGKHVEEEEDV